MLGEGRPYRERAAEPEPCKHPRRDRVWSGLWRRRWFVCLRCHGWYDKGGRL